MTAIILNYPEINGIRSGALIHPTTNLSTLGKAVSNGCVGLSEADAWLVYYYAPLGTQVRFRYDLEVHDKAGKIIILRDIYDQKGSENQTSNDHPTD
jgi:L,D-transpeptidase ErfK/SrfK